VGWGLVVTTAATNLSAISRLFSSSVFRQLAEKGRSPLFARLLTDSGLLATALAAGTVGSSFDIAFAALRKSGMRDEYVYRSALTHNILLGRHSLKTASLLTEFRAGSCKADVAILNGTSTVYEIKSERDTLSRLENQLQNYRKVFAKVYVVVAEPFIDQVLQVTDEDIGVMSLVRWDRVRTVREAVDRSDAVCPLTIFDSLRLTEAIEILNNLGIEAPDLPNTKIRAALREQFAELPACSVHDEMVRVLKRARSLAALGPLVDQLPQSLKPAALSTRLRLSDHNRLVDSLHTPTHKAMEWAI
jgi:hypothetical protein